jgi:uncharacterized membrane protein YtjA (UPF0391 family)
LILFFLVVAILAAIFGFGGTAGTAAGVVQVVFWLVLVLFIIALFFGGWGHRPVP